MMSISDIELFLPRYLSEDSKAELKEQLDRFPEHYGEFYTNIYPQDILYQGDGITNMPVYDSDLKAGVANCLILSNTCDMDKDNHRIYSTNIMYCPIFNLSKIRKHYIDQGHKVNNVDSLIASMKRQACTSVMYLPPVIPDSDGSIIFLDRIYHIRTDKFDLTDIHKRKMFSLSNFGFYCLLFKLSIHLTRMQEGIDRG